MPSLTVPLFFIGSMVEVSVSRPLKQIELEKFKKMSPPEKWAHVISKENPADIGSRGIAPGEITDHKLWWNGPSWLKEDPPNWHPKISAPPSLETLYSSGIDEASLQLK